ncbi:MAG: YdeI/OmpD-associated family protein [Pseudomonadota bacterium]
MNLPSPYPFGFEAPIERFGVGKTRKIWYKVVFLPGEVGRQLPLRQYPRLRVEGEIADIPVANAFIPAGDGRHYLIVAPEVLQGALLKPGDTVTVRFRIADQDHVEVPPALARAIATDAPVRLIWDGLPPGRRRMLAQHVAGAKTAPTGERRVVEALEAIRHHRGDLRAWRRARG